MGIINKLKYIIMKNEKRTFSLTDQEAKEIYESPDRCKALLENQFPFLKGDVIQRLQTIDDVFRELNETKENFNKRTLNWPSHKIGQELTEMIAKAFNEGKNHLECIYYPYFRKFRDNSNPSGFGLSYYFCVNSSTIACVGSRQLFFDSNHAKIAGERFVSIYHQALLS